jgi:hypothetical protein
MMISKCAWWRVERERVHRFRITPRFCLSLQLILFSHFLFLVILQLTIEWTPQSTERDTVDHYEETRSRSRRRPESLKVAPYHRKMYLQRVVGVSRDEMEESIRVARDVRRKRHQTVRNMKNEKFEMMVQSLQRKTARLFVGSKTDDPVPVLVDSSKSVTSPLSQTAESDISPCRNNNQTEAVESLKSPGRRSFLRRLGSSSRRRSCPDLSASCHPILRDRATFRRVDSLETDDHPWTDCDVSYQ